MAFAVRRYLALVVLLVGLGHGTVVSGQTRLLRFPDVSGNRVVFCYAGDLWSAPVTGGTAVRLTSHPGQELFPKFSPDGNWIAFTGQYDGDEQVYVMPAAGGVPKELTFYPARGPLAPRWGYDHQVYGWTPDGRRVVFRSLRDGEHALVSGRLYTVAVDGGLPEALPMPTSGAGDFSPDGRRIVYSPLFRDFRTWKRYQGGWAQDLFLFDLESETARNITDDPRTDRDPMWIGDRIYFASDRDGHLNLYAYDVATESLTQITRSETWDVRWPSSDGQSRIVYELGGELQVLDTTSGEDRKISITVPDDGVARRPSHYPAEKNIEDFSLSPKGERALFVARGDIFTAPIEKGPTRNLTNSSGAHDKWARWSPDGARIAFLSDRSGEDELYVIDQAGGEPEALTSGGVGMRYAPAWSPDGERIAFSDKEGKIYLVTVDSRQIQEIADEARGQVYDYAWSPDSGHLAFSLTDSNFYRSLYIWSVEDQTLRRITDEMFDEHDPAWDPSGDYLYYLSEREFAPQISTVEWNFATNRTTGIFALPLRRDVPHPFPPESDEVTLESDEGPEESDTSEEPDTEEEDDDEPEETPVTVRIDFEGLAERAVQVPVESDNYGGLVATKEHLLYIRSGASFYGRESYTKPALVLFAREGRKESVLAEDAQDYAISSDGTKVLVKQGEAYALYDAKPEPGEKKTVSTSGLAVDRVPVEEWRQIFDEVWRQFRDFFYVRNMHGYDWAALREQYRPLLEYVGHRSDLNYVLGEMVAELNVGHAYIQGGDFELPERPPVALPGARFELDEAAGRYRIADILPGQNEEGRYRSPLTEAGIEASVGDYVLAIDGEELRGNDNPYRLLRNKVDPVTLTLNDRPNSEGAREVTYRPIRDEQPLLYLRWVARNRERVAKLTDGRVGYIHLPDMGETGISEFIKWYYPQIRKEGLVVDVRSNGGGNVSEWIIERLDQKLLSTRFGSTIDDPLTYPNTVFHGHLVCVQNETSASDGDIFPASFRAAGLGPLIGKRSWGGVVGIQGRGPLIDGGQVYVPQMGTNAPDGSWIIEGYGVEPDIVVENDVLSVLQGRDPQLERAVEEVIRAIRESPRKLPVRPADPVKTP
jgi:tricorn protease